MLNFIFSSSKKNEIDLNDEFSDLVKSNEYDELLNKNDYRQLLDIPECIAN